MFSLMVLEHRQGSVKGKGSEILPSMKVHVHQDADVVLLDEPTGHLDVTLGAWSALGISTPTEGCFLLCLKAHCLAGGLHQSFAGLHGSFIPTFSKKVAFGILVTQENREKMVTVIVVSHDA